MTHIPTREKPLLDAVNVACDGFDGAAGKSPCDQARQPKHGPNSTHHQSKRGTVSVSAKLWIQIHVPLVVQSVNMKRAFLTAVATLIGVLPPLGETGPITAPHRLGTVRLVPTRLDTHRPKQRPLTLNSDLVLESARQNLPGVALTVQAIDWAVVREDIVQMLERGSDDTLAPTMLRLAWHASGTFDGDGDPVGGIVHHGATMRFEPEAGYEDNRGLQVKTPRSNALAQIQHNHFWCLRLAE